jgi:hypothetical protein
MEERRASKRKRPSEASETVDTSRHLGTAGMLDSYYEDKTLAATSERVDTPSHLTVGMLDGSDDDTSGPRYIWR